jgi:hypothetical protein
MPTSSILTPAQQEDFDRIGVLRLPGLLPIADVAAMAHALWADLASRYAIVRDDPATWITVRPAQFQALKRSCAFAALGSPRVRALADSLLGAGAWEAPRRWGQPLVTFPSPAWNLPRVMWHLDYPVGDKGERLTAVKLFAFLEPVLPHGGGTLVVAGSHKVATALSRGAGRPARSADMRERLKAEHPWFARLWATPGDEVRALLGVPSDVGGVTVEVQEMTGAPGDLVLMHPAMLHGLAHNALERPRMMLTQGLERRSG